MISYLADLVGAVAQNDQGDLSIAAAIFRLLNVRYTVSKLRLSYAD